MKLILSLVFALFISPILQAQSHYNIWSSGVGVIPLSPKFTIKSEFQYRTQNGYGNKACYDKGLRIGVRNWLWYKRNKHVEFAVSPLAYFSNNKVIENKVDELAKPINEYRFTIAVNLKKAILTNWFLTNRTMLEYRHFKTSMDAKRLRNQITVKYKLSAKLQPMIFEELVFNLPKMNNKTQFRLGALLEYKATPKWKVNFGYMHTTLWNNANLRNENLLLSIGYKLGNLDRKQHS